MKITKLVVHHSASPRDTTTVAKITEWHKEKGFTTIGYHKVILGDGSIKDGRSESTMGAHAKGANQGSLGVCLTGNFETEQPTTAQVRSLVVVLSDWCRQHRLKANAIYGHFNVPGGTTATACPGANLKSQMSTIKENVTKSLPKYSIEFKIKDPSVQKVIRKVLSDGRISFDETKEIIATTVAGGVTQQELEDLKQILINATTLDAPSKKLISDFVALGAVAPALPLQTSSEQLTTNFKLSEFACRDGSPVPAEYRSNVQELAKNLQVLRDAIGKAVSLNCGYRTPKHNKAVGGVTNSQHLTASAADLRVSGMTPANVQAKIIALISDGKMKEGGVGLYKTFVHYDIRGSKSRWSKT